MNIGRLIFGLLILAGAVWIFIAIENFTLKFLLGIIVGLIGIGAVTSAFVKNKE